MLREHSPRAYYVCNLLLNIMGNDREGNNRESKKKQFDERIASMIALKQDKTYSKIITGSDAN